MYGLRDSKCILCVMLYCLDFKHSIKARLRGLAIYLKYVYLLDLCRGDVGNCGKGDRIFRQSFVPVLNTSGKKTFNSISKQYLIKSYLVVQESWAFSLTDHHQPDWCSTKPRHRFAISGNVKMFKYAHNMQFHQNTSNGRNDAGQCKIKYAKFDPNMHVPCGSRVMSIFTNWPRPTGPVLRKASTIKKGCLAWH